MQAELTYRPPQITQQAMSAQLESTALRGPQPPATAQLAHSSATRVPKVGMSAKSVLLESTATKRGSLNLLGIAGTGTCARRGLNLQLLTAYAKWDTSARTQLLREQESNSSVLRVSSPKASGLPPARSAALANIVPQQTASTRIA